MNTENSLTGATTSAPGETLSFDGGILGFEDVRDYRLIQEEALPVMTLRPVGAEHPSFIVLDPFSFVAGYKPVLSAADRQYFHMKSGQGLRFLVIAVLRNPLEESVVNLKSPLVIDPENRLARQVFLENAEYPIRFRLFKDHV